MRLPRLASPSSLAAVATGALFVVSMVVASVADAQVRPAGGRGFRPTGAIPRGPSTGASPDGAPRRPDEKEKGPKSSKRPVDAAEEKGGVSPTPGSTGDFDWELWWYHNLDRYLSFAGAEAAPGDEAGSAERRLEIARVVRHAVLESDVRVQRAAIVSLGKVGSEEDVAYIESLLAGGEHKNRVAAALALGHTHSREAGDFLERALADPKEHPEVRAAAALALGLLGDEKRLPAIFAVLAVPSTLADPANSGVSTGDLDLRVAALLGAGLIGGDAVVARLAESLADAAAPPIVRSYSAIALGKSGSPSAAKPLLAALASPDASVKASAVIALGALGVAARDGASGRGSSGKPFGPARDQASLALARVLDTDPEFAARCLACFSLGQLNGSGARSALQRAASGGDPDLRCSALVGLGLTGDPSAAPALRPRVADRSHEGAIGAAAALGLALLGEEKEAPAVRVAFEKESRSDPRAYLALSLGLLRARDAVPNLAFYAKSTANPPLSRASLFALAVLGDPESLALLRSHAAESEDQALAVEAVRVLGDAAHPEDVKLMEAVLAREDASWSQRFAAVQALGRMAEPGRTAPLSRVFESNNYFLEVRFLENVFESL